jgi:hypothetical protein
MIIAGLHVLVQYVILGHLRNQEMLPGGHQAKLSATDLELQVAKLTAALNKNQVEFYKLPYVHFNILLLK